MVKLKGIQPLEICLTTNAKNSEAEYLQFLSSPFFLCHFPFPKPKKSSILLAICLHQSDFICWHLSNDFLTLAALLLCDLSLQSSVSGDTQPANIWLFQRWFFRVFRIRPLQNCFRVTEYSELVKKSQKIRNHHRKRTNNSYTNLNIKTTFYEKQHYICTVVETYQWVYLSIFKVYWKQFRDREARLN